MKKINKHVKTERLHVLECKKELLNGPAFKL